MNRAERRKARATAGKVAGIFARCCADYDRTGKQQKVTHPRAIALLERAFTVMLQNGGEPHTIELTQKDAATFPRGADTKAPEDCPSWLAVGVDREGRGTYTLRHSKVFGPDTHTAKRIAIAEAQADLAKHTAYPGFPGRV